MGEAAPMFGRRDMKVAPKMMAPGRRRSETGSERDLVNFQPCRLQQFARQGKSFLQDPGPRGETGGMVELAAERAWAHGNPLAKLSD